jgi:O-antigen/teichoic acid export membrane protein
VLKVEYFSKLLAFKYASELIIICFALFFSFFAANLLGPEKYGLITYLMGFIGGLPLIFGFEAFYDLLKVYSSKTKSRQLVKKIMLFAGLSLLILFVLIILFANNLQLFLQKGDVDLIMLLSILVFLVPVAPLLQSILSGFKSFGKILKLVILEKVFDLVGLLVFFFVFDLGFLSVFFARVFSLCAIIVLSVFFIKKLDFAKTNVSWDGIKKFSSQSVISNILKGLSIQLELWMFGSLLTLGAFGIFYLIKRISLYSFDTIQNALSEVLLPFLSEQSKKEVLIEYTSKAIKFQVLLNLVLFVLFVTAVPFLISILFPKYVEGVLIIPLLGIGFLFNFSAPLSRLIKSINKNWILGVSFGISLLFILIFGFLLIPTVGLYGAAIVFASNKILMSFILLFSCYFVGYKVEVIPRKKDLIFFILSIKKLIKLILKK